eukprot:CAMPEP_0195510424 /NCGR_PEP_ID=MMETSP0794_2-20130614/3071_1 /TAXON_ID=515487 /ORGANISM="Stephanopyxis turris, Strain CCMP 815" /LENGTH=309 /DNA_ID=CAMNT_0040637843 /DNA_START=97 /DNA_END=1022 /DNA_ORIENTATION=-
MHHPCEEGCSLSKESHSSKEDNNTPANDSSLDSEELETKEIVMNIKFLSNSQNDKNFGDIQDEETAHSRNDISKRVPSSSQSSPQLENSIKACSTSTQPSSTDISCNARNTSGIGFEPQATPLKMTRQCIHPVIVLNLSHKLKPVSEHTAAQICLLWMTFYATQQLLLEADLNHMCVPDDLAAPGAYAVNPSEHRLQDDVGFDANHDASHQSPNDDVAIETHHATFVVSEARVVHEDTDVELERMRSRLKLVQDELSGLRNSTEREQAGNRECIVRQRRGIAIAVILAITIIMIFVVTLTARNSPQQQR